MVVSRTSNNGDEVFKFKYDADFQTWTLTDDSYSFGGFLRKKAWTTATLLKQVGFSGLGVAPFYIEDDPGFKHCV
jgi:hypothetical protein